MIKQILFSLALTSTAIHSMDLTVAIHNPNILFHVTHKFCNIHDGDVKKIKCDLQRFAKTDKTLYAYYAREKTQQNIVRRVALHKNLSDSMIALYFGYPIIKYKIDRLFAKRHLGFTEQDLLDEWYLDSTRPCASLDGDEKETLIVRSTKRKL